MNRRVQIIQRREVFHKFIFRIEEVTFRHQKFDGSMSPKMTRLVFERGDSVAMLLHDREKDRVLLCEQLRVPTLEHGSGWLIELPAGTLDQGEDAKACARRETVEETGYLVKRLRRIACVYLSPGASSERIHILYGEVSMTGRVAEGGGVAAEGEDIRLISMPATEAISKARRGRILDAKTMIGLQWLESARQSGH